MRLGRRAFAVLTAALLAAACSSADEESGTQDLNRSLLSQPASDGLSTPLAVDEEIAREGPRVPVASVGFNRGSAEAPVKVIEMSDYGCGYCRQFHQQTFPTILSDYIDRGMVEWKFVPFVTGMFENSRAVTEAAECALAQNPDAFERLNRRLWDAQAEWKGSTGPEAVVRGWASELGIDMATFDGCLADDERLDRVVASTTLARQLGVRGTPTFIVLGYPPLQGALPLEIWQQILTAVHAEAVREGQ